MDQYGLKRKGKRAIFYSTTPQDQTDCVEEMSQCIDNQFEQAHILQTSNCGGYLNTCRYLNVETSHKKSATDLIGIRNITVGFVFFPVDRHAQS